MKGYKRYFQDSCFMGYLMNGGGITLSLQNFVEGFLFVLNCNCLLKVHALLVTISPSK
jgi:hypothetical protein